MSDTTTAETLGDEGSSQRPPGIRIASTLCWVVGVLTLLTGVAVGIPLAVSGGPAWPLIINVLAGALIIVGAVFVRKQRRLGALFVAIAWALPTAATMLAGQTPRGGPLLLIIALLLVLANWRHFK